MGAIFNTFENFPYLHILIAANNFAVNINLPKLQFGFSVGAGLTEVFSRQFRGMYIDSSQAIDILMELRSKFILINSIGDKRAILIPDGKVIYFFYTD